MAPSTSPTRRGVLLTAAGVLAGLAGCSERGETGPGTTATDRDLREANVVGVETSREGERVTFDVTLHHDDEGEDGYANWWQVETLDGDRLGRRDLTHPHTSQPFTRSGTFAVGTDVSCVVVRGHDGTHGYGGQAMTVEIETGATRVVSQGTEKRPVDTGDCP
jgi:hypothetical protein